MTDNAAQWLLARKLLPGATEEEIAKLVALMTKNISEADTRANAQEAEHQKLMEKYKDPV